jgi:hypothetical protein
MACKKYWPADPDMSKHMPAPQLYHISRDVPKRMFLKKAYVFIRMLHT